MLQALKAGVLVSVVLVVPCVFAEPYVGIEYQQLAGTRTQQDYHTNQVNAVIGYEWALQPDIAHGVEYTGPISSSSAKLGDRNVETMLISVSYRMNYKGLFGKVGYGKLDRDDDDLEATATHVRLYSVGYELPVDDTTVLRASRDYVRSSAVSTSGWSLAAIFRF